MQWFKKWYAIVLILKDLQKKTDNEPELIIKRLLIKEG